MSTSDVSNSLSETTSTVKTNASNEKKSAKKSRPVIQWSREHENILVEWADKAMCYQWLHEKSKHKYNRINYWFTIPVIIISTVTGTLNFAQEKFPEDYRGWVATGVGSLNIFAGIITTIHQYLKYVELNESHRVSAIAWAKFYRNLTIELSRKPVERTPVDKLINRNKEEFDRLMETSPDIPADVLMDFKINFMGVEKDLKCTSCKSCCDKICCIKRQKDTDENIQRMKEVMAKRDMIFKPEVCDVLISTTERKYKYVDGEDYMMTDKVLEMIEMEKAKTVSYDQEINMVNDFKKRFKEVRGREPSREEIIDNLEDNIDVTLISRILSGEISKAGQNFDSDVLLENIKREYMKQLDFKEMVDLSNSNKLYNNDKDTSMPLNKKIEKKLTLSNNFKNNNGNDDPGKLV